MIGFHCRSCGDQYFAAKPFRFENRTLCEECFKELKFGEIPKVRAEIFTAGHYGPLDDNGPWQENAIRAMEDG